MAILPNYHKGNSPPLINRLISRRWDVQKDWPFCRLMSLQQESPLEN